MSLKSFDKFCENLILSEPGSKKDIFDERQNQVRSKLTIEALTIFSAATVLNTLIMECGLQWCESYFMPIVLLAALCYLYWIVRNAIKGSMFGVKGTYAASCTAGILIGDGIVFGIITYFHNDDYSVMRNGMVSQEFLMTLVFGLILICGIVTLVIANKEKKLCKAVEKADAERTEK